MKIPHIHSAHVQAQIEPLIFFAQCLAELLFDHTIDSYKAPALDTVSRALELSALAHNASLRGHSVRALDPAIEELEWSLHGDPAIRAHHKTMGNRLIASIKNHRKDPRQVARTTDALLLHLRSYWPTVRRLITECLDSPNRKNDLLALAGIFTTQIELLGFSRRYAYHLTNEQLYKRFTSPTPIPNIRIVAEEFLSFFDQPNKEWTVIYRANQEFFRYASFSNHYDISISKTLTQQLNNPSPRVNLILGNSTDFPNFIKVAAISARDPFAARQEADVLLEELIDACKFHSHTSELAVNPICVWSSPQFNRTWMHR